MLSTAALATLSLLACEASSRAATRGSPARGGAGAAVAAGASSAPAPRATVEAQVSDIFEQQRLIKRYSDQMLFAQLGPEAIARKIEYPAADGMTIPAYLFAPGDTAVRRPVIVMVHGGVHSDFNAGYATEVGALVRLGYLVIAPEYRGSTGYGRAFYDAIDYGGREVEDCISALDYLAASVPFADTSRVGMLGWSHGGFIALHALFRRPERFRVAVAHVPVADLPTRIRTHPEAYHEIFAAQTGFGGRLEQNPRPYIDRSPIAHARELRTPVLVHTADNDEDVFIVENHHLRDSMVAAGMDRKGLYIYREFHDPPGGHSFTRADTPQARESWAETTAFLARYLGPAARRQAESGKD
ncbi:MAG: alpha/beta fold hydrolase [Gemmatimonadaceae bacterium]